jgi:hypothetical protein
VSRTGPGRLDPPAAFNAPWQLRIYAAAAAAAEAGRLDRDAFLDRFTTALGAAGAGAGATLSPEEAYRCWLDALEQTLRASGALSASDLAAAVARQTAVQRANEHH